MNSLKGPIQCIGAESVIIQQVMDLKKSFIKLQKIEEKIMETMEW